jgi:hypothetical protein
MNYAPPYGIPYEELAMQQAEASEVRIPDSLDEAESPEEERAWFEHQIERAEYLADSMMDR